MTLRINPKWIDIQKEKVSAFLGHGTPFDIMTDHPVTTKWMITYLAEKGVVHSKISLGAGVYRFTSKTKVCPKCNGTGHI